MKNVRLSLNTVPQFLEHSIWNIFTCGMDGEWMYCRATIPTHACLIPNPMLSILHHSPPLGINPFCKSVLFCKFHLFKTSIKFVGLLHLTNQMFINQIITQFIN